jgi:hypothetical protein
MEREASSYSFSQVSAGVMMILTLLWLMLSTPFVYQAQKELAKYKASTLSMENTAGDNEECNPFGNTTEEKTESNFNTLSEYLHHIDELFHLAGTSHTHNCCHSFSEYVAFHGELLCPPPNFILS